MYQGFIQVEYDELIEARLGKHKIDFELFGHIGLIFNLFDNVDGMEYMQCHVLIHRHLHWIFRFLNQFLWETRLGRLPSMPNRYRIPGSSSRLLWPLEGQKDLVCGNWRAKVAFAEDGVAVGDGAV